GHLLDNSFPDGTRWWEYCSSCRYFWISDFPNQLSKKCPAENNRGIKERVVCGNCMVVTGLASGTEPKLAVSRNEVIARCPGCEKPRGSLVAHKCDRFQRIPLKVEGACPACNKRPTSAGVRDGQHRAAEQLGADNQNRAEPGDQSIDRERVKGVSKPPRTNGKTEDPWLEFLKGAFHHLIQVIERKFPEDLPGEKSRRWERFKRWARGLGKETLSHFLAEGAWKVLLGLPLLMAVALGGYGGYRFWTRRGDGITTQPSPAPLPTPSPTALPVHSRPFVDSLETEGNRKRFSVGEEVRLHGHGTDPGHHELSYHWSPEDLIVGNDKKGANPDVQLDTKRITPLPSPETTVTVSLSVACKDNPNLKSVAKEISIIVARPTGSTKKADRTHSPDRSRIRTSANRPSSREAAQSDAQNRNSVSGSPESGNITTNEEIRNGAIRSRISELERDANRLFNSDQCEAALKKVNDALELVNQHPGIVEIRVEVGLKELRERIEKSWKIEKEKHVELSFLPG
ncbi:MAG: hypothetical protein ACREDR_15765, partial [Blastocatellia bacterium]